MLNFATSQARQPRGVIKLNGEVVTGWAEWSCSNNSFYQADTFSVTFAYTRADQQKVEAWFSGQKAINCEIFAGFPIDVTRFTSTDLDSVIYGKVDELDINPVECIIEIHGRDMSSVFIDAKTTEKFQNLTSSEIVEVLAKRRGLKPVVEPTKTKAGTYYQIDHADISNQQSEWDLLTYLAGREQYQIYVKGHELHFKPLPSASDEPYILQWIPADANNGSPKFNGKTIRFSRALTIAQGVSVTVKSWSQKQKKAFTAVYPKKKTEGTQNYSFVVANKTQEECLQIAQQKHKEISRHEMKLEATLPGDSLTLSRVVKVVGTGTEFDQIYFIDNLNKKMDIENGYEMTISAKNTPDVSSNEGNDQ